MTSFSRGRFRLLTLLLATVLFAEAVWLFSAELTRSSIDRLPTDVRAAAAAARERDHAVQAATIGLIRGDLWADDAYTYATLLFHPNAEHGKGDAVRNSAAAHGVLDRALAYAPHQSGAWLFLAGLAVRYPAPGLNTKEALEMSFFTGPSEPDLLAFRLRIAVETDAVADDEIRPLVARDLRLLLARRQDLAITDAYDAASLAGKRLIETSVGEINPSLAKTLAGRAKKPSLPD
jgi:hypothetical protein